MNGDELTSSFDYYAGLARKGVVGFIIFGGELNIVRDGLDELRRIAARPLIIASDLEQGLGQHVNGGTIFPPAMAIASAVRNSGAEEKHSLLVQVYSAFAQEALYAGINTIFAPVLDINTNPKNPIIATRSFGEDADTVSGLGCEMIRILQNNGVMACAKHFPGHGDTETDSHVSLPVLNKDMKSLELNEIIPFKRAVDAGVKMMMLGHLSVPAIDPSGTPASLSGKTVSYLKDRLGFRGFVITDAMNMGGIGSLPEEEASLRALVSGVDIILHPTDPDKTAAYLKQADHYTEPLKFDVTAGTDAVRPDFENNKRLSVRIAREAVKVEGSSKIQNPFVVVISDDPADEGSYFISSILKAYPGAGHCSIIKGSGSTPENIPSGHDLIIGIFSSVKAWKGDTREWIASFMNRFRAASRIVAIFGNPYALDKNTGSMKICAYWSSRSAQEAAAEKITAIR